MSQSEEGWPGRKSAAIEIPAEGHDRPAARKGHGTLRNVERLGITYRDAAVLVRARDLMTPVAEALTIQATQVAASAARALDRAGFDYAPVVADGAVAGYAAAPVLRDRPEHVRDHLRSIEVSLVVAGDTPFPDLLVALRDEPFLFVLESRSPVGFVTRSDLNKHTARLHYYFLLAGLEIALANLVRLHYSPIAKALDCLTDDRRNEIVGRYSALQATRLDLDELASADLSDIVAIVETTPDLRQLFGDVSRRAFHRHVGWLPEFRHSVMHAVRPLLAGENDVAALIDREDALRSLFDAAAARLRSEAPSAFTRW